jgi:large subunit ribosomal protein L25
MDEFVLIAEPREEVGSRACSRLRARGRLPANIYGHNKPNVHCSLDTWQFTKFLTDGHRILRVRINGSEEHAVVKEVQYDSLGSAIVHVDFTRIRRDEKIQVEVAIELIGIPKGVNSGGVLSFERKEVLVSGFPQDIPEIIRLDVQAVDLGHAIRIKDLPAVAKCEFVDDPEFVVLMVAVPRGQEEPVEGAVPGPTEPEIIKRKPDEEGTKE